MRRARSKDPPSAPPPTRSHQPCLSSGPGSESTGPALAWTATPVEWLAAIGMLVLFALALIWLATALGLAAKSVETASNTPMFLTLLPFLGSGFVPTATMPQGLRQFAEYQPFTPVTETLRGLLTGTPIGSHAIAAIGWSVGLALLSYVWALRLYQRRQPR